jgi:hypothetical protein
MIVIPYYCVAARRSMLVSSGAIVGRAEKLFGAKIRAEVEAA